MLKKTLEIVIPAPFPPFPSDRGRNNGKAEHPQNWAVLQVSLGLPRMPLWLEATGTAGSTPGQPQNSATASGREGSILQSSAVMCGPLASTAASRGTCQTWESTSLRVGPSNLCFNQPPLRHSTLILGKFENLCLGGICSLLRESIAEGHLNRGALCGMQGALHS